MPSCQHRVNLVHFLAQLININLQGQVSDVRLVGDTIPLHYEDTEFPFGRYIFQIREITGGRKRLETG